MNWFAGVANRSKALTNYLLEDYEPADPKWSPTSQSELAARQPATPSKETGQARMLKEYIAELCKQPNTFIKFPLADYEGKLDGERWRLNTAQEEHARNMLMEVSELSKLRYSLCPAKMSDTQFWNIYFLLLRNKGIDLSDHLQAAELQLASPAAPKTPSSLAVNTSASLAAPEDSLEDELDERWLSYITASAGNNSADFSISELEDNYFNPDDFSKQLRAANESKEAP